MFVIGLSLGAWLMLRVRADAWTVYKPNPDWSSAARVLQAQADEHGRVAAFGFANSSGLKHYVRRHSATGVIVRRCTQSAFDKEMARRGGGTLCLVRNRFWDKGFETLLQRWRSDERLNYLETRTVRLVDLYLFQVAPRPVAARRPLDPESVETPELFGDGFESGDTAGWSLSVP